MPIARELVFRKYRLESWPRLAAEVPFRGAEWTEGLLNRAFELRPVGALISGLDWGMRETRAICVA
jgi:hypothetical protein